MVDIAKTKSLQAVGETICREIHLNPDQFDGVCQDSSECLLEAIELNQASLNLRGEAVGVTLKTYARALMMACDSEEKADVANVAIAADLMCPLFRDPLNGFGILFEPAPYTQLLSAIRAGGLCLDPKKMD